MEKTYYVSVMGSDDNDGLSPETPFKTFKNINCKTLSCGDKVLLRRGDVFCETLIINGKGAPDSFIEVSAYGEGERPKIQLNGDISERCLRTNNASYLKISSLEVCNAGAGIVIFYDNNYNNRSVYVDDVIAHDFYGIYRACGESSSREEWKSYVAEDRVGFSLGICITGKDTTLYNDETVLSDFRITNCEIYKTGGGIGLDWCDHHCSDGSNATALKFTDVLFDNINMHDNDVEDVSLTSMFLQCVTNATFSNSIIDNGAGGAPWGTAAIHLQLAKNVTIDNVTIKNMPHTGVSDECGIDFETDVENCVIKNSTFENNAGAGVEFLCNYEMSSQAVSRGVVIDNCKFINNNYAKLYDIPGQIHVQNWQQDNCPTVVVSNCVFDNPKDVKCVGGTGIMDLITEKDNKIVS